MAMLRLLLFFSVLTWLPNYAIAEAAGSDHRARLLANLNTFVLENAQKSRPHKVMLTFSFTSEADGLAFIAAVKSAGARAGVLTEWPDKNWRTEASFKLMPTAMASAQLGKELQELLSKYNGTYWNLLVFNETSSFVSSSTQRFLKTGVCPQHRGLSRRSIQRGR